MLAGGRGLVVLWCHRNTSLSSSSSTSFRATQVQKNFRAAVHDLLVFKWLTPCFHTMTLHDISWYSSVATEHGSNNSWDCNQTIWQQTHCECVSRVTQVTVKKLTVCTVREMSSSSSIVIIVGSIQWLYHRLSPLTRHSCVHSSHSTYQCALVS